VTDTSAVAAEHADSPTSTQDPFARPGSRRPRLGAGWRQRRRGRGWTCHPGCLDPVPEPSRRRSQAVPCTVTITDEHGGTPTPPGPSCPDGRRASSAAARARSKASPQSKPTLQPHLGPSRSACVRSRLSAGEALVTAGRSSRRARIAAAAARRGRGRPRPTGLRLCPERRRGYLAANVRADVPPVPAAHPFSVSRRENASRHAESPAFWPLEAFP
jgi:hypothetical protein